MFHWNAVKCQVKVPLLNRYTVYAFKTVIIKAVNFMIIMVNFSIYDSQAHYSIGQLWSSLSQTYFRDTVMV